jgi:hypothetical protein
MSVKGHRMTQEELEAWARDDFVLLPPTTGRKPDEAAKGTGAKHSAPAKKKKKKATDEKKQKKKDKLDRTSYKYGTESRAHVTIGHVGVSISATGELKASGSEGMYSWEDYFPGSKLMLMRGDIKVPLTKDANGIEKGFLPMVTSDREQYEINNTPSAADFRKGLDIGLGMLYASDGVNAEKPDEVADEKSSIPTDSSGDASAAAAAAVPSKPKPIRIPKWAPEFIDSEKAHLRVADPGRGFVTGLPAVAWANSFKTGRTVPYLRHANQEILIYVVNRSKEDIATDPYISQFIPDYGIPAKDIMGRDEFLKEELEVLEDTKTTEDGDKAPAKEVRAARRNLIYINGAGSLDHVFRSELFPSMHTMIGFTRSDMLYAPSEKDLPTAYKMAMGKSDLSGQERRQFMKSYLTEDLTRHFVFTKSNPEFSAKVAAVHSVEQKEMKADDIAKHCFGEFDEYFIMARLFESVDSKHCVKIRTSHRPLSESVARAKADAKVPIVVQVNSSAATVDATIAATTQATHKAEALPTTSSVPDPPAPADLSETLYSAISCEPHRWWAFSIQKIPPEIRTLMTKGTENGKWTWAHGRLLARRIVTLWKQELTTRAAKLKIPPGHIEPIIYQEDVRHYISKFASPRIGWHYHKPRSFKAFQVWSSYACPGQAVKDHDHSKCVHGMYMHHVIDDIPTVIPDAMRGDGQHQLLPLIELLTEASYQETSLEFFALYKQQKQKLEKRQHKPAAAVPTEAKEKKKQTENKHVTWSKGMTGLSEKEAKDLEAAHEKLSRLDGDHKLSSGQIQTLMNFLASSDRKARAPVFSLQKSMEANSVSESEAGQMIKSLIEARKSFNTRERPIGNGDATQKDKKKKKKKQNKDKEHKKEKQPDK